MKIDPRILSKAVKTMTPKKERVPEMQVRGTIVFSGGEHFVRLDGASGDALTPIAEYAEGASDAGFVHDDRVLVLIKDHQAIVTKNLTTGLQAQAAKQSGSFVTQITDEGITAQRIIANDIFTYTLRANHIKADDIIAGMATIDTLDANYAHITDGVIDNAKIGHADVKDLNANYAKIDMANVNNAWIENGAIKKAEVFDENVFDLSGNRATLSRIDASKINVANLRADNLVVRRINGQPVVGGYTLISNTSPGYESKNPQELGWYEFVNAQWVLSTDTTVDMTKAYYQEGDEVSLYDQTYIDGLKNDLQQQIDGAVETFTGSVVPTLVNYPYTDWYDTSVTPIHDERAKHVGDIYYVINSAADEDGYAYRFAFDETNHEYMWVLIKDSDVTKALSDITELQTFESETTSWIDETDQGLETIRTNHTALSGRVDNVEATANAALPAATFQTFESTTFTDLVDEVDEQSTTMTNMTTRLGLNADGTGANTDIVAKESALEQTVDGISTRVGKTEMHLAGMYATSSTAAGTAAKVATIVPALSSYELVKGAMVTVKFTEANTTASPTLNLNGTGAKAIKTYSGGNLAEAEYKWKAGSTFTFTYNGTNWLMQDSTASVRMNTSETQINQTANSIESLASNQSTYTKPDGTTGTNSIASAISQNANNINLKVSKNDVINQINVSTEGVKIDASKVNITGTTIFNAVNSDSSAKAAMLNSEIEIGGRNLIWDSEWRDTRNRWYDWGSPTTREIVTINGQRYLHLVTTASQYQGVEQNEIVRSGSKGEIQNPDPIVLSFTAYAKTAGQTFHWGIHWRNNNGNIIAQSWGAVELTTTPQRYVSPVYTVPTGATAFNIMLGQNLAVTSAQELWVSQPMMEKGTKASNWSPAPEDVQGAIDAKKSIHTLTTTYSQSYSILLGWAREGNASNWTVTEGTSGIKIGDTVRFKCSVSDMNNAEVYVVGTVTAINSSTNLRAVAHGLDTTIIDGGNILTNSIGANQIDANAITIGKLDASTRSKVNEGYEQSHVYTFGNVNVKWMKIGHLKAYTARQVTISLKTGVGYNGESSQNTSVDIDIKTGNGQSATKVFGTRVVRKNANSSLKVKVIATATASNAQECDVYIYLPWNYNDGSYTVTGSYQSWTHAGTAVSSEPTGNSQEVVYDAWSGAHITEINDAGIKVHAYDNRDSNYALINSDGMNIYKGGTSVAQYGDTARVGPVANNNARTVISGGSASGGMDVIYRNGSGSDATMAHIGYASGNASSGTAIAPYYTFGVRQPSSSPGNYSVAEGFNSTASGFASHAEGIYTKATGIEAHAEGSETTASGSCSHAEGNHTTASGGNAHAEGDNTTASGYCSHASGSYTTASSNYQFVVGYYNKTTTDSLFIVGNGDSADRNNAFSVSKTAKVFVNGSTVHSSDRRLKEHLAYVGDEAIEFIDGLKPAYYIKNNEKHVGFYAQDVQEVDKWDCMTGEDDNGYMTLCYMDLIAPLVTYCQKLEERIEELEKEVC